MKRGEMGPPRFPLVSLLIPLAMFLGFQRGRMEHHGMMRAMRRPPGFPLFPLLFPMLFPMGLFLGFFGLTTWFSYKSYRELDAIRRAEEAGTTRK